MSLKRTHVAGDPWLADDVNDLTDALMRSRFNIALNAIDSVLSGNDGADPLDTFYDPFNDASKSDVATDVTASTGILSLDGVIASGTYESIVTAFQELKKTIKVWVTRSRGAKFNLDAGISAGATSLTILGDETGTFANGDEIQIYDAENLFRDRKTLTSVPSFGGGVTTLSWTGGTDNAYATADFVERVDVIPRVSLVDEGTAKSFNAMTYNRTRNKTIAGKAAAVFDAVVSVTGKTLSTTVASEEDRVLIVYVTTHVGNDAGGAPTHDSVAFGAQSMTKIVERSNVGSGFKHVTSSWVLAAPAVGTDDAVVTIGAEEGTTIMAALTFHDADQVSPVRAESGFDARTTTTGFTFGVTSEVGDIVTCGGLLNDEGTETGGATVRWDIATGVGSGQSEGQTKVGIASSTTMGYTTGGNSQGQMSGVAVKPAQESNTAEDEYDFEAGTAQEDMVIELVLDRVDTSIAVSAQKLVGVALDESA